MSEMVVSVSPPSLRGVPLKVHISVNVITFVLLYYIYCGLGSERLSNICTHDVLEYTDNCDVV